MAPGIIRKPAFNAALINDLPIFAIPDSFGFDFFIQDTVKEKIDLHGLKGIVATFVDEPPSSTNPRHGFSKLIDEAEKDSD